MREQGIVSASLREEERQFETALRPVRLADFAGQARVKENLSIAIEAAKHRGEAMDHVLLYGPLSSRLARSCRQCELLVQEPSGVPMLEQRHP
jgi:Holliday junction DNA helicase RuvB